MNNQRGAILLLALLFLLLTALVAESVMHTSILELRMAGNDQHRDALEYHARMLAEAIFRREENFPVDLPLGQRVCSAEDAHSFCDDRWVLSGVDGLPALSSHPSPDYYVEKLAPMGPGALQARRLQGNSYSSRAYGTEIYETRVHMSGNGTGGGQFELVQGVMRVVPTERPGVTP